MKLLKLLLSLLFLTLSLNLYSNQIPASEAGVLALSYFSFKVPPGEKSSIAIKSSFTAKDGTLDLIHVFNFSPSGWIMMSADDRLIPVLAYSLKGSLTPDEGAPAFQEWVNACKKQISAVIKDRILPTAEIDQEWSNIRKGNPGASVKGGKSIQPLLMSTWDQGSYYNYLCPEGPNGAGGRVYAGCVATCMAQVMYYYRHPDQGTGSHSYYSDYGLLSANFGATTYDWNAMQNNINHTYNVPMALIQYHCGIAVDMMYSPDGSGAYMDDAAAALVSYFDYSPSTNLDYKSSYSETQWKNMLKAELDALHPLCYAGFGDGAGHAFVCDGYDNSDMFHFNWGWSGYADGYFYINNLNPSYTFTDGQQAIFGMVPENNYPDGCSATKTLTAVQGTIEDGSGPIQPYSANRDCFWLIDPETPLDHINISFQRFDTESVNDIVTVYDGPTTADSVLGVFSGSTIPSSLSTSGGSALIRFTSNASDQRSGWFLTYQGVYPEYCDYLTTLTDVSGSFSDGSDQEDYIISTYCRWRITPPGATGITIQFNSFDLEGTDFVMIYDEANGHEVTSFTGSSLPSSVFVFSSKVMVIFMSDYFGVADGFSASYTSSNSGISELADAGLMVYPNPAGSELFVTGPDFSGTVRILLTDLLGQICYEETTLMIQGVAKRIDVSQLAAGMYHLTIDRGGQRLNCRVVLE